jgi:cyclophilin family peptidyl-prolyl cis-trans isomerase
MLLFSPNLLLPFVHVSFHSMASIGVDTVGSQFYITLSESPQLNGRCTAFGRIVEGEKVFESINKVSEYHNTMFTLFYLLISVQTFTVRYMPSNDIVITNCGLL